VSIMLSHYITSLRYSKKIIKSYYILVKQGIEYNSQEKIYHEIIGYSHEIEDTSLDLLIKIANIEKEKFSQKANSPEGAANPRFTEGFEALIRETSNYIKKLEGFRNKALDKEFAKNIQDYTAFVKLKYNAYIRGTKLTKALSRKLMSEYSINFNMLLEG
jgi:hypothetical protein